MIFNKNLPCKLRKGGFRRALFIHQLCEGRCYSDEGFVCEACAEAEAGDEAVEAVGVEKVSGDREVLLEARPLFLGKRSIQLRLKLSLLLHQLFHAAIRTDGAMVGREISVV